MSDIAQDLGGVVRLLEKATPGELLARVIERDGQFRDAFVVVPSKIQGTSVVGDYPMEWMADDSYHEADDDWQKAHDARATAAAINFLRTHRAEIAGALRDAERYRWLRAAHGSMDFGFWQVRDFAGCIIGQQPEELDNAIDSAMQQGGGGGDHA